MILDHNFGNSILSTKRMKFKHIFLGIMVIVTLASVNAYGTAFAGDSLNSINPNYQSDQSSSSSSDNTGSSDQPRSSENPHSNALGKAVAKTACTVGLGAAGNALGNMIVPGVGGAVLGTMGSNLCG